MTEFRSLAAGAEYRSHHPYMKRNIMKMKEIFVGLLVGLALGLSPPASAVAANVDVINNSTETISVSTRYPAPDPEKRILAPGGSTMFGVNVNVKVTVIRELNPVTTRPSKYLKDFLVSNASKTYQVTVSGNADSAADVTLQIFSGSAY